MITQIIWFITWPVVITVAWFFVRYTLKKFEAGRQAVSNHNTQYTVK